MTKFVYNNAKNANISHILLVLNCSYYPWIFYKKDIDFCSKFKSVHELSAKFRKLIIICRENLYYAQKLKKWYHNIGNKLRNYAFDNKSWLNIKYIKTKQKKKLKAKLFGLFQIFYLVGKANLQTRAF